MVTYLDWQKLEEMWNGMYIEHQIVNDNIELPKGYDGEWNKKIIDANVKIRDMLRELGNIVEMVKQGKEEGFQRFPELMKEMHDGFSYYYGLLLEQRGDEIE